MTEIQLYNTLSRDKETFHPQETGKVSMYCCGPTVYDIPHIGNYRTFVLYDLLRRVFEYNSLSVNLVMNVTDVDDKTIKKSRVEGVSLQDITRKYEKSFIDGLALINITPPSHLVRATENIQDMIVLIQSLLDKGIAYKADDGIYVSIAKVKNYGQLAGLKVGAKTNKERIANDEYDKENPSDFAVWKFKTDDDGDVAWPASFGDGRPGWHIECSAMAMKALGPTIDVHAGAIDLIFPHHTNEIAQSESATDKQFVKYWVHGGFMTIKDEKMAKSTGNFLKLDDLSANSLSPLAFRYWLLTAHYRSPMNFSFETIESAQNALIRLITMVSDYPEGGVIRNDYKERFEAFVNNDIDMPRALALVWELVKDAGIPDADKRATILDFDRVFGLGLGSVKSIEKDAVEVPPEIHALAELREQARKEKDWAKADALRKEIEDRGFTVRDVDGGFVVEIK